MTSHLPVYIGTDAVSQLLDYCRAQSLQRFLLVADPNTFRALGQSLEQTLRAQGCDVRAVLLNAPEVIADERSIMQVMLGADGTDRTYLAVGAGTINDIVRFVSHRARSRFISVPTAPSVDGFTSVGAPLVFDGFKQTVTCQGPAAVFADLSVLAAAPPDMRAAGFGDLMGKFTATADWKLGHVLWDERYDESIAQRSRQTAVDCIARAGDIAQGSTEAVRALVEGLIESGLCILDFGQSHPASGSEHHLSHFWELKLLREGRPALLHGANVGVASVSMARLYERLRVLSRDEAAARLQIAHLPDRALEVEGIKAVYGSAAEQIVHEQAPFLEMPERAFSLLKQRILDCWDTVQEIAAAVPAPQQLSQWLRIAGAPVDGQSIGFSDEEVAHAVKYGHYLRNRFTILKLNRMLRLQ